MRVLVERAGQPYACAFARARVLFDTVTFFIPFSLFLQSTRLTSAAAVTLAFAVCAKADVAVHSVFHVRSRFLHHPTIILSLGHTSIFAAQFLCRRNTYAMLENTVDATHGVDFLLSHHGSHETSVLDCINHCCCCSYDLTLTFLGGRC